MAQTAAVTPVVKTEKKKFSFNIPHLLWIMIGLILLASLLTYVVPAGSYPMDAAGKITGSDFAYTGVQKPVNPWKAMMMILDGLIAAGPVLLGILAIGGGMGVILDTKAIDRFLDWATYKLRTQGTNILVPTMFLLMGYIGAFGGSDAMVAVVPVGIMFAKKLKLDPIVAIGITTFAALVGFAVGPNKMFLPQALMGVPIYSGFGVRFLAMNFFLLVGLFFLMRYVRKIQKDPSKSAMGSDEWIKDLNNGENVEVKETKLDWRTVAVLVVFLGQYLVLVWLGFKDAPNIYRYFLTVSTIAGVLCGVLAGMKADQIGRSFEAGLNSIAFVAFIIGLARTISLVMADGGIIHTIVYTLTKPLIGMDRGMISIGLTGIISVLDLPIPSASAKAAIIMPILQPMAEALKIHPQLIVQAFQFGDGFSNIISPILGWTVGSTIMAKVPLDKWIKWSFPKAFLMLLLSFVWIYVLYLIGWTGY